MTEYDWTQIRTNAVRKLGETPGAQLEQELIEAFLQEPRHIAQIIDTVIAERDAGATFASGWGIIRHRAQQQPEPITATDQTEREKAIRLAAAWIKTAGLYLNDENELLHELFGQQTTTAPLEMLIEIEETTRLNPGRPMYDSLLAASIAKTTAEGPMPLPDSDPGKLSAYDTPQLRQRILDLYREHRPRGREAEADAERRAQERRELRAKLAAAKAAARPPSDPEYDDDPAWEQRPEPELAEA